MSTSFSLTLQQELFLCSLCNIKFMLKKHLQKHHSAHHEAQSTEGNRYSCEECEAQFSTESNWKTHLRTHTGSKEFSCDECSAMFVNEESLKVHVNVHKRENRYFCPECGTGFTLRSSLSRHVRRHHAPHSYACSDCVTRNPENFAISCYPAVIRTKSYTCTECEASFGVKSNLLVHLRTHATMDGIEHALRDAPSMSSGTESDKLLET